MEYFEYRFGYKYNFSRNDKFGNFKNISVSCSNFYGIDGKYFDGTEMFENKLIFIFVHWHCLLTHLYFHT